MHHWNAQIPSYFYLPFKAHFRNDARECETAAAPAWTLWRFNYIIESNAELQMKQSYCHWSLQFRLKWLTVRVMTWGEELMADSRALQGGCKTLHLISLVFPLLLVQLKQFFSVMDVDASFSSRNSLLCRDCQLQPVWLIAALPGGRPGPAAADLSWRRFVLFTAQISTNLFHHPTAVTPQTPEQTEKWDWDPETGGSTTSSPSERDLRSESSSALITLNVSFCLKDWPFYTHCLFRNLLFQIHKAFWSLLWLMLWGFLDKMFWKAWVRE